ncbi:MAG: hypothetical protein Q4E63_07265 [Prevotellaceae bacterium]|nr:hypothetical protein [Prevotellaceae bacterium]MDO4932422.1 hypothetical protein [Prevotellaceae bacterium]
MLKKFLYIMPLMALFTLFSLSSCSSSSDDDFIPDGNQNNYEQENSPYTYSFATYTTQDQLDFYDIYVTIIMADGTKTAKRLSETNEIVTHTSNTYQDFNITYRSTLKKDAFDRIEDTRMYQFPEHPSNVKIVDSKNKELFTQVGSSSRSLTGLRLKNNLNYFEQNYDLNYKKGNTELEFQSYNEVEYVNKDANTVTITEGETFVDLGLSVKWASKNLAIEPYNSWYNRYFAWGEVNTKHDNYTWNNYKWWGSNGISKYKMGVDGLSTLQQEDDAAYVNRVFYGGNDFCRLPTANEARELVEKCTWTWGVYNEEKGYKVEGPNGNSIFLPAAGNLEVNTNHYLELYGFPRRYRQIGSYWTSELCENVRYPNQEAYHLCFQNNDINTEITVNGQPRYAGCSIRAVSTR